MPEAKVAIVTGGSSGIGLALARLLLTRGWRVAIAGRDAARLRAASDALGARENLLTIPADVGDTPQARRVVRESVARFGRLDALVNNAGFAPLMPIEQGDDAFLDSVYRVNTLGPAAAIAEAWPTFTRQRSGVIVNVSTYGTKDPFPGFFAYAAAKAAAESMIRSVKNEGASIGVRGYAVAPGAVETPLLRGLFGEDAIPASQTLRPEAVAGVIAACCTGETGEANGSVIYLASPGAQGEAPEHDAGAMEAPTLPDVLTDLWRRLERGATERRHPYHQPVVSSMGEDASPRSRTVVLRNADRDGASLVFHTDARSPKCAELRANTALTWTFYDPASKVQLRVRSRAEVLTTGEIVDQRWANTRAMGRRCYLAPRTPGVSVGDQPDPNLPEALRHREPTEQESKPGRANFAVVRCAIESVDWLHLRHDGHRRAQFVFRDRKPDGGAWLAP